MALVSDAWIPLLIGGTLLLVGFAASLVFERYRVPDFFILLLLGVVLGNIPVSPFGPDLVNGLAPFLPVFIQLTLALVLFSGGLTLNLRGTNRIAKGLLGHTAATAVASFAIGALLARFVIGLSDATSVIVAAAFAGPSATIIRSFAPRLELRPEATEAIDHEAIVASVIAAVIVLFAVRLPTALETVGIVSFVSQAVLAMAFAFFVGFAWRSATAGLLAYKYQYVATLALAVVVFGVAEGLIGGNGLIAAFVLGLTMAPGTSEVDSEMAGFRAFQGEITFGLRAFFFVYLGLLFQLAWFDLATLFGALVLTGGLVLARAMTSAPFGRSAGFSRRETRAVTASVGRGLTHAVLILFAAGSAAFPAAEEAFVLGLLPLVILLSSIVCSGLVAWAERGSREIAAKRPESRDIYRM